MKTSVIYKIAVNYMKSRKLNTVITVLCCSLAVALTVTMCCFSSTLLSCASESVNQLKGVCIVLTALTFFISYFLIKTVFSVSFGSRVKLFGMLSSLGADARQITGIVVCEAGFYAVAGSVLGFSAGLGLASPFAAGICRSLVSSSDGGMTLKLESGWLAFALLSGFLAVGLASASAVCRARSCSPIEMIRTGGQINVALKRSRFGNFMNRTQGVWGELAGQFYYNNKPQYRLTAISLAGGMTLFSIVYSYSYPIFATGGRGPDIDGVLYALVYLTIASAVISFVSATGSMVANAGKRIESYCVLKSLGCTDGNLYRLSLLESVYLMWGILWRGFIGTFSSSLFMCLWAQSVDVDIPLFVPVLVPFLIFAAVDFTVCAIIAVYTVFRLRKTSIAETIISRNYT